jgi:histidinol phosphatase-like PHP family hydrolase
VSKTPPSCKWFAGPYNGGVPDVVDLNIFVSGLLDDLAAMQTSMYPRKAYERAARKIALLPERLHEKMTLPDIGKTATRVVREVLATGSSATVERAMEAGTQVAAVEDRRARREGFLSLAIARQVLASPAAKAVGRKDYLGDFQMHSQWSDGSRSIAEMAIACADRGYTHMAVTDHTDGLKVARGLSATGVAAQHREIDEINAATDGRFRVIKGIETNILADGSIDLPRATPCELVLAAPHSKLESDDMQTSRLLRAIATPGVHILAHPSGRKFGKRSGLRVDWARVFDAAAKADVAIEIDGDPSRQDVPYALARQAHEAGCLIAIDSDAHDTDELVFSEIALAHARLAGIPPARVINTWPTKKLMTWLASR